MTPYQPTNIGTSIAALVFYVLMAVFLIYSLFALYSLLRHGRSKILGIIISLLFLLISASLYAAAVGKLSNLH